MATNLNFDLEKSLLVSIPETKIIPQPFLLHNDERVPKMSRFQHHRLLISDILAALVHSITFIVSTIIVLHYPSPSQVDKDSEIAQIAAAMAFTELVVSLCILVVVGVRLIRNVACKAVLTASQKLPKFPPQDKLELGMARSPRRLVRKMRVHLEIFRLTLPWALWIAGIGVVSVIRMHPGMKHGDRWNR